MRISPYYNLERSRQAVSTGAHRELVGGLWGEIGGMTRDLLVSEGLTPEMRFLDIGCGCLRVGVHLVDYLQPGRYFGTDLSEELMEAGREHELRPLGLVEKLPSENLLCDGEFNFTRFQPTPVFDMALAQSVFTHLPINHLRLCLARLGQVIAPGGKFFATVFHSPDDHDWSEPLKHEPGGVVSHAARDPYHHRVADLDHCAAGLDWTVTPPRSWGHPRNQSLTVFTHTGR